MLVDCNGSMFMSLQSFCHRIGKKQLSPTSCNESVNLIKISTIQTLSRSLRKSAYTNRLPWLRKTVRVQSINVNEQSCGLGAWHANELQPQPIQKGQLVWMREEVLRPNTRSHEEAQWHRRPSLLEWMHICEGTRCLAIPSEMKTWSINPVHTQIVRTYFLQQTTFPRKHKHHASSPPPIRLFILITKINTCSIIAMLLRYSPYHYRSGRSHLLHAYSIHSCCSHAVRQCECFWLEPIVSTHLQAI